MAHSVSALLKFVPQRESEERCDLCGTALESEHKHNLDLQTRKIRCVCASCSVLYSNVYRLIPRRVLVLSGFEISNADWDNLMIPISLAFFCYSSSSGRVVTLYPGPAGVVESLLRMDAWEEISSGSSQLKAMEPDVEALLVNRVGTIHEYYLVPIDECYKLVGLIRLHWRGLSGGAIVWGEIASFFKELHLKGESCPA